MMLEGRGIIAYTLDAIRGGDVIGVWVMSGFAFQESAAVPFVGSIARVPAGGA